MYQKIFDGNISFYCYDPVTQELILTFSYKDVPPYSVIYEGISDRNAGIMLGKLNRGENPEGFVFTLNKESPEFHQLSYVLNSIDENCLDDTPENEGLNGFLKYAVKDIPEENHIEISEVSVMPKPNKMFHMKPCEGVKSLYDISVYIKVPEKSEKKILPCYVMADSVESAISIIRDRIRDGFYPSPMIDRSADIDVYSVRKVAETDFNINVPVVFI